MIRADLLEVTTKNGITYFKIREIGVGTVGTYTESAVYKAIVSNQIQISNISIGIRLNEVIVNPSFLAMQIHKGNISKTFEYEEMLKLNSKTPAKKKKKPKSKAPSKPASKAASKTTNKETNTTKSNETNQSRKLSYETDPRIMDINSQILEIDKRISGKNVSLGIRESQILHCDDEYTLQSLNKLADDVRKDLQDLWDKKAKLQKLRQDTINNIQQEKIEARKLASKRNSITRMHKRILAQSPYTVEEYNTLIEGIRAEIREHEIISDNMRFRYEKDREFKIIRKLTRQLKLYESSKKLLEDAIESLKNNEIEG